MTSQFDNSQTWKQRQLSADAIYEQVAAALKAAGKELPKTLRRPDVRLIVNNVSGEPIKFMNPGDHAKEQAEPIPASGPETAVMIMLEGKTLAEQMANAETLTKMFDLDTKGLTKTFAQSIGTKQTEGLIQEAYGPAPFEGQTRKLVPITWEAADGSISLNPKKFTASAYGTRAATEETVFRSETVILVKGTKTVGEAMEMEGMCIAIDQHWKTKAIETRPIAPSVAKEFYGAHYSGMPTVTMGVDGYVQSIDLGNGEVVNVKPNQLNVTAPTSKDVVVKRLQ